MLTLLAWALLIGPMLLFALNLAWGAWRWWHMSEGEREMYRRIPVSKDSEWARILNRGY